MLKAAIAKHGDDIKAVVLNFPSNQLGLLTMMNK
jgi:aminotransferase